MFRLIEPSSGLIQNIVLVLALTDCTSTVFCIWADDGLMSRNMSSNFEFDYQYMLCLLSE